MIHRGGAAALTTLLLLLSCASTVSAADTIFTGLLSVASPKKFFCMITNTSTSTQLVSGRIINFGGHVVSSSPQLDNFSLDAGTAVAIDAPGDNLAYCRITGDGPPKSLLVTLCAYPPGGNTADCVLVISGQSQGSGGF